MMTLRRFLIFSVIFGYLLTNVKVYAGGCVPGTPGCPITSENYAQCAMNFPSEYKNINGVIVAPVNSTISRYASSCGLTVVYHNDANSYVGSYYTTYTPYIYITGNAVSMTTSVSISENYVGTPTDIINGINYATYDYYTGYKTTVPELETSYVPSISQALSTIDYGNPLNDIFYEVTIPTLKNLANNNPHITYTEISSALATLTYIYDINSLSTTLTITSSKHAGKVFIKDYSGNTLYSTIIPTSCSKLEVSEGKVYCDGKEVLDRTYKVPYQVNNTTYYITKLHPFEVTYTKEIRYEKVFEYFNNMSGTSEISATVTININTQQNNVICTQCASYKFTKPGIYYVTYTGYPRIENQQFLIVKPALSGTYHTTIYPESKIETHYLFNVTAVGIGLHNITVQIGTQYSRTLTINEGTKLTGKIKLDFNKYVLYIDYYENGSFVREDYVMSLTQCKHKDCDIPYKIYYDDGYGFTSIPRRLFASSYIKIRWNILNYTIPKVTIHETKQFTIPITVTNLGPVTAKEVNVHNLKYNSACLDLWTGSSVNISVGGSDTVYIYGKIKSVNCKSQDYIFSFDIYGWNTYSYPVTLSIPVSKITSPAENTLLGKTATISVKDLNTNKCSIKANTFFNTRTCNSNYAIYYLCEKSDKPDCYVEVISENPNFKFISKDYHFRAEAYLSISHKKATLKDSQSTIFYLKVTDRQDPNVDAKDVKITKIIYNSSCLNVKNLEDVVYIPVNNVKELRIKVAKIKDFCRPEDYKITIKIQGYNTKEYSYDVYVPVSSITFPPKGTTLTNLVTFKIWDVNTNNCSIYIEGNKYSRTCNSSFVYNNYCTKPGVCVMNVSSDNEYFTYYSSDYTYSIPNLASKGLVSSYTPNTLYLKQGSSANVYITLTNTLNKSISCSVGIDTNLLAIKDITQDGKSIVSMPYSFTIPPSTTLHFLIYFQAVKLGMDNTKVHFSCSGNRRIDIILPTVVYTNQPVTGSVKTESVDEKVNYVLILGAVGLMLII